MDAKTASTPQFVRSAGRLGLLLLLVVAGGASCPRMVEQYKLPTARVLPSEATLEQVTMVVNENSSRIQSLSADGAKISSSEFPTLHADLAVERPQRMRLIAKATALTGAEFDFGSNDELFWFWVKRPQPPALYFCRHDQFDYSSSRNVLPVDPDWLIEALGIVTFDPAEQHQGPFPVGKGNIKVCTIVQGPTGQLTKVRVIDSAHGWIVAQHIYDANGQRLASATASGHRRDPQSQAILPRHVEIQWPQTNFSLKIDLGDVTVNQLATGDGQLWTKPEYPGWPDVDLATVQLSVGPDGNTVITPVNTQSPPARPQPRPNEARVPTPDHPDATPSGDYRGGRSPLGDPLAERGTHQAGFRRQVTETAPPTSGYSNSTRREIRDYAAEPVLWR